MSDLRKKRLFSESSYPCRKVLFALRMDTLVASRISVPLLIWPCIPSNTILERQMDVTSFLMYFMRIGSSRQRPPLFQYPMQRFSLLRAVLHAYFPGVKAMLKEGIFSRFWSFPKYPSSPGQISKWTPKSDFSETLLLLAPLPICLLSPLSTFSSCPLQFLDNQE